MDTKILTDDLKKGKCLFEHYVSLSKEQKKLKGIRKSPELYYYLICKLFIDSNKPVSSFDIGRYTNLNGLKNSNEEDFFSSIATRANNELTRSSVDRHTIEVHNRWQNIFSMSKKPYRYAIRDEYLAHIERIIQAI